MMAQHEKKIRSYVRGEARQTSKYITCVHTQQYSYGLKHLVDISTKPSDGLTTRVLDNRSDYARREMAASPLIVD